jgi:hypothetical protein
MATAAANRFRVSTTPTARVRAPRARTGFHGRSIGAEEGDTTGSRLDIRVGLPSKAAARAVRTTIVASRTTSGLTRRG